MSRLLVDRLLSVNDLLLTRRMGVNKLGSRRADRTGRRVRPALAGAGLTLLMAIGGLVVPQPASAKTCSIPVSWRPHAATAYQPADLPCSQIGVRHSYHLGTGGITPSTTRGGPTLTGVWSGRRGSSTSSEATVWDIADAFDK